MTGRADKKRSHPRGPQVFDAEDPDITIMPDDEPGTPRGPANAETDGSGSSDDTTPAGSSETVTAPPGDPAPSLRRGIRWGRLLVTAFFALVTLTLGVWFTGFVSIALQRDDWIGWTATGLAIVIGLAVTALVVRELIGFVRLARITRIRRHAEQAIANRDAAMEERVITELKHLARARPDRAWALRRFRETEHHPTRPLGRLELADTILLKPCDTAARRVVYESARRVTVVTAVVPITFIAVLFVLFENIRMVRRLATTYGGQPGFIGGVRLLWRVIAYVAASGAIALTDDLFGQFLGQDIVRRISRRLGEGAFNGALTARLGVAAIDICRPIPFIAATPLRARHIVTELFPEFKPSELVSGAFRRQPRSP